MLPSPRAWLQGSEGLLRLSEGILWYSPHRKISAAVIAWCIGLVTRKILGALQVPITFGAEATDVVTIEDFEYKGQKTNISYHPSVYTPRFLAKMTIGQDVEDFLKGFCSLVCAWDVENAKGPVPVIPETVEELPIQFLRAVMNAIQRDIQTEGKAQTNSSAG